MNSGCVCSLGSISQVTVLHLHHLLLHQTAQISEENEFNEYDDSIFISRESKILRNLNY